MQLLDLLPSVRQLAAADKLHLIRLLAMDIDDSDDVSPIEHSKTYSLATPHFEPGAADALLLTLATQHS